MSVRAAENLHPKTACCEVSSPFEESHVSQPKSLELDLCELSAGVE